MMPVVDGYKTLDLVMQEVGLGEPKVREAIKDLKIEPVTFRGDRRVKYYSQQDIERIKEWARSK